MSPKSKKFLAAAGAVAVLGGGGAAIAVATGGGDDDATDKAITGSALDRAKRAALADTPGHVTETEVGDEESYYEVEVTRDDGSQVDVQLNRDFKVVGSKDDGRDAED